MEDAIQVDNRWYIPATSSRADDRTRVLKSADSFTVFSRHGEIGHVGLGEQGFYFLGTRHLSRWQVLVAGREPMLLNSTVRLDNSRLMVDQTTPDLFRDDVLWLPKGTLHLHRELAIHESVLSERLVLTNYHRRTRRLTLEFRYQADYRDIFEVRGARRDQRGTQLPPEIGEQTVVLGYEGLDGVVRRTRIHFDRLPQGLDDESACFEVELEPGDSTTLEISVSCASGGAHFHAPGHAGSVEALDREREAHTAAGARIWTDNEQFNDWLNRSSADLRMLLTGTRYGPYPYAGVPWFSTPFGRDGLITALQTLWARPSIARGVLGFLAATQADHTDPATEAEPGKIIHELREGEMAALGEIPFRRYYGSVDATPLFVLLAGRYYQRSGDRAFIREIWPSLRRALDWMAAGEDRHGFLTYARHGGTGLVQQGWKDSDDAVFHRDARAATPPIALCEVQGYAFEAWQQAARLAERLGEPRLTVVWKQRAERLQQRFEQRFWLEQLDTYALALDGDGQPCAVRSSNPAHLLYTGMVSGERAARVARGLVSPEACNGWGLRTLFEGEPRYNPMSYHNGSVWPHDTALAAAGLARYGHRREMLTLLDGLFNASIHFDLHRLPELFCGFDREPGQGPTHYPVACAPQAWASGAVFMLVEALLGLRFDPEQPCIHLQQPVLPDYINWLRIRGLEHLGGRIDLVVRRHGEDIAVNIEKRVGDVELNVTI